MNPLQVTNKVDFGREEGVEIKFLPLGSREKERTVNMYYLTYDVRSMTVNFIV